METMFIYPIMWMLVITAGIGLLCLIVGLSVDAYLRFFKPDHFDKLQKLRAERARKAPSYELGLLVRAREDVASISSHDSEFTSLLQKAGEAIDKAIRIEKSRLADRWIEEAKQREADTATAEDSASA